MVYQTVLLPHRHSLKTGSLDEAVTPNTSPAQWPGTNNLNMYEFFVRLIEFNQMRKN